MISPARLYTELCRRARHCAGRGDPGENASSCSPSLADNQAPTLSTPPQPHACPQHLGCESWLTSTSTSLPTPAFLTKICTFQIKMTISHAGTLKHMLTRHMHIHIRCFKTPAERMNSQWVWFSVAYQMNLHVVLVEDLTVGEREEKS